jgi:hypothetical protein
VPSMDPKGDQPQKNYVVATPRHWSAAPTTVTFASFPETR